MADRKTSTAPAGGLLPFKQNKGGRPSDVPGDNDCVVRAIAVAGEVDYATVREELRQRGQSALQIRARGYGDPGKARKARRHLARGDFDPALHGVVRATSQEYLFVHGWEWLHDHNDVEAGEAKPMTLLDAVRLPGRLVVFIAGHALAIIDHCIHDEVDGWVYPYPSKMPVDECWRVTR